MVRICEKKFWQIGVILEIEKLLKRFSSTVDNEIMNYIPQNSKQTLYDAERYVFSTGGKRLRSTLCLLTCETLGGDVKKAIPFGAAIEVIHNASLVHDDLEDGDKIRRNSPTVWVKYGIPQGINVGDGLISKAYECLLSSKNWLPDEQVLKLCEMFTNALILTVEGQDMEFDLKNRNEVTIEEYTEMAQKKAGMLIGLSLSSGAFIAGRQDLQSNLMEYGKKIGTVFQIKDDILNLFGKVEYGKEIGSDIKEGKKTIMIIDCLNKCELNEKEKSLRILKKDRTKVTKNEIKFVVGLIKKYKSKDTALNYAKKMNNEARAILKKIDNKILKNVLSKLSDFMLERRY